jgi:hypothetical protein
MKAYWKTVVVFFLLIGLATIRAEQAATPPAKPAPPHAPLVERPLSTELQAELWHKQSIAQEADAALRATPQWDRAQKAQRELQTVADKARKECGESMTLGFLSVDETGKKLPAPDPDHSLFGCIPKPEPPKAPAEAPKK